MMTVSWYRSFCSHNECFADSMKSAILSRPLSGHQIRRDSPRGANFWPVPVRVEAGDHLLDLDPVRRRDGVVPRLGQVARFPVERFDEPGLLVDHHRLLVREREIGVAVADFDPCGNELLACVVVVARAVAARGIQHHPDDDTALPGRDDGIQHRRIREQEHPYLHDPLGGVQRFDDRRGGVVGEDYQVVGHGRMESGFGSTSALAAPQAWAGPAAGVSNWM
jgi:hypothetical protein